MRIARAIAKRLLAAVPILLILTATVFVLTRVSGVDPARAYVGFQVRDPDVIEQAREELGLNEPLPIQFIRYNERILLHGDLGTSVRSRRPVTSDLRSAVPATLELLAATALIAIPLGLILGFTSAITSRGSGTIRVMMIAGASAPVFLVGLAGIYIFFGELGWLPASGRSSFTPPDGPTNFLLVDSLLAGRPDIFVDGIKHLIMPAVTLALLPAVAIGRVLRRSLEENLSSDYVRTARSKGIGGWSLLRRHVLRNSINAPLSIGGLQFGYLLAGAVIVELVFAWPGMGFYLAQAIPHNDFPAIAGVTLVVGMTYILINVVVDILQAIADPRISL